MIIFTKLNSKVVDKQTLQDGVGRLPDGKYIIKKYIRNRTNPQNRYLHQLFSSIAKDAWEDTEYIKRMFKTKFLMWVSNNKWVRYPRPTHNLTTVEFAEFVDNILNFMAELWYNYATPDEWKEFNS